MPQTNRIAGRNDFTMGFNGGPSISGTYSTPDTSQSQISASYNSSATQNSRIYGGQTSGTITTADNYNPHDGTFYIDNVSTGDGAQLRSSVFKRLSWSCTFMFQYEETTNASYRMIVGGTQGGSWNVHTYGTDTRIRFDSSGGLIYTSTGLRASGRKYIMVLSNDSVNRTGGARITWLADNGASGTSTGTAGASGNTATYYISCAGWGSSRSYSTKMRLGHFIWWNDIALSSTEHDDVIEAYRYKYGF